MKSRSLAALALSLATALAQEPAQAGRLDKGRRSVVIDSIARLLDERYVFPEKAAACASLLTRRLADGAYDTLTDPDAFARALTADLQSVTADKHLCVRERRARTPGDRASPQRTRDNHGFARVEVLAGNVGYLDLRRFAHADQGGDAAVAAMALLAGCDALVFDLRRNPGGHPSMIQLLCSYLFAQPTHLNSFFWRGHAQIDQFWTFAHVPGKRMPDVPVYVLTSGNTFSAAEEFTYDLKQLGRATIVGETTGGGAHPGGLRPVDEQFEIWIPQGRAINPVSNDNWEGTGVAPDVAVPASQALTAAHRHALAALLANAERPDDLSRLRWHAEALDAASAGVELSDARLTEIAGGYDGWQLQIVDGRLWFARDGGSRHELQAMSPSLFALDGRELRLRVDERDGAIVGTTLVAPDGPVESAARVTR